MIDEKPKKSEKTKKPGKKGNFLARKKGRRYAMQALYGWRLTDNPVPEIEADMLTMHAEEVWDRDYFHTLLFDISSHDADIAQQLSPHLIDRSLNELDPIEWSILHIAAFELIHRWDVPYRVVINEAIDLAKQFGATDGHKFVNAVLDKMVIAIPGRDQT